MKPDKALDVQYLSIDKVQPNPWNPNVQNDTQFRAEVESITRYGFIAPILVRQTDDGWQVIDGEHRLHALTQVFTDVDGGETGTNVDALRKNRTIPAVVVDVSDAEAKKLTVVMNETRGRADLASLSALLADITTDLGDDVLIGLPYSDKQLREMLDIANFDWDSAKNVDTTTAYNENEQRKPEGLQVTALIPAHFVRAWKDACALWEGELPKDPTQAAGVVISKLLEGVGV